HRRLRHARGLRLFESLFLHGHAPARLQCSLLKFSEQPITRSPNPALRVLLIRKRVTRAKAHQLANRALDVSRVDLRNDFGDLSIAARAGRTYATCRAVAGRLLLLRRREREIQGQSAEETAHEHHQAEETPSRLHSSTSLDL